MKKILPLLPLLLLSVVAEGAGGHIVEFQNKMLAPQKLICIDGKGSTSKAWKNQNVQSYYCDKGPDQRFELWRDGKALSAFELGLSTGPLGTKNIQEYDHYGKELWFEIRPIYQSTGSAPLCLDVEGYSGGKGKSVQFWTCQNLPDQKWKMMPDGRLINKQQGMCLDIKGYNGASQRNMKLWSCDFYLDQHWFAVNT